MNKEELVQMMGPWQNVELCARHMADHPGELPMLVDIALEGSTQEHWHAAWAIDKVNTIKPALIRPYLPALYKALKKMSDSSRLRTILKVLASHPVPVKQQGFLFDFCLNIFTSESFPVAVRANSAQILYLIAQDVPGLKPELVNILEHELSLTQSAGIRSRCKNLLQQLTKAPKIAAGRRKNL